MFSLNPNGYADETRVGIEQRCVVNAAETPASRVQTKIEGDVFVALPQCLDDALWKIGGRRCCSAAGRVSFRTFILRV